MPIPLKPNQLKGPTEASNQISHSSSHHDGQSVSTTVGQQLPKKIELKQDVEKSVTKIKEEEKERGVRDNFHDKSKDQRSNDMEDGSHRLPEKDVEYRKPEGKIHDSESLGSSTTKTKTESSVNVNYSSSSSCDSRTDIEPPGKEEKQHHRESSPSEQPDTRKDEKTLTEVHSSIHGSKISTEKERKLQSVDSSLATKNEGSNNKSSSSLKQLKDFKISHPKTNACKSSSSSTSHGNNTRDKEEKESSNASSQVSSCHASSLALPDKKTTSSGGDGIKPQEKLTRTIEVQVNGPDWTPVVLRTQIKNRLLKGVKERADALALKRKSPSDDQLDCNPCRPSQEIVMKMTASASTSMRVKKDYKKIKTEKQGDPILEVTNIKTKVLQTKVSKKRKSSSSAESCLKPKKILANHDDHHQNENDDEVNGGSFSQEADREEEVSNPKKKRKDKTATPKSMKKKRCLKQPMESTVCTATTGHQDDQAVKTALPSSLPSTTSSCSIETMTKNGKKLSAKKAKKEKSGEDTSEEKQSKSSVSKQRERTTKKQNNSTTERKSTPGKKVKPLQPSNNASNNKDKSPSPSLEDSSQQHSKWTSKKVRLI
jgi:hypothetical protein